jgi:hypothetical protein
MAFEYVASGGLGAFISVVVYGVIRAIQWYIGKNKQPITTVNIEEKDHGMSHQQGEELRTIFIHVTEQKIQQEYLRADIRNLREGQEKVEARITELIISQQKLTDRLADLVGSMDRLLDKMKNV